MEIISRKEAKEKGLSFYFTGKPCKHGHIAKRRIANNLCVACQRIYSDNYWKNNKDKRRKSLLKSVVKWTKANPELDTILKRQRAKIQDMVARGQGSNPSSSREQFGCAQNKLIKHIESQFKKGMNWENRKDWDIDHVRPCASFNLVEHDQQLVCFNWRNMRPMWSKENQSKNDTYTPLDEVAWVERMLSLGYEGELFLKYEEGNSY